MSVCSFPHITWTPCTAHCVDLLLEDIGKLDWVDTVIKEAHSLVKFITNHQSSLAIFRTFSKHELLRPGKPSVDIELRLALLIRLQCRRASWHAGETRIATQFIQLARVIQVRKALQQMVADEKWDAWVASDKTRLQDKAESIAETIASASYFRRAEEITALLG